MSEFLLSPGITPDLTDAVILLFVFSVGVGYALRGAAGLEVAVGLNVLLLGVIKLVTDYSDPLDVPVALAGILAGVFLLLGAFRPGSPFGTHRTLEVVIGVILVLIGVYKVARDFYDPFDILLAALFAIVGAWMIVGRYGVRRWTGASGPVPPPSAGPR